MLIKYTYYSLKILIHEVKTILILYKSGTCWWWTCCWTCWSSKLSLLVEKKSLTRGTTILPIMGKTVSVCVSFPYLFEMKVFHSESPCLALSIHKRSPFFRKNVLPWQIWQTSSLKKPKDVLLETSHARIEQHQTIFITQGVYSKEDYVLYIEDIFVMKNWSFLVYLSIKFIYLQSSCIFLGNSPFSFLQLSFSVNSYQINRTILIKKT